MLRKVLLVAAVLFVSAGCENENCDAGATRCRGEIVEVCDAEGHWVDVADCLDVTATANPSWRCCAVDGFADAGQVHACLPASECTEAAR